MSRPPFEVADIIRVAGDSFRQRYSASLTWPQRKVLDAIAAPNMCCIIWLAILIASLSPTIACCQSRRKERETAA